VTASGVRGPHHRKGTEQSNSEQLSAVVEQEESLLSLSADTCIFSATSARFARMLSTFWTMSCENLIDRSHAWSRSFMDVRAMVREGDRLRVSSAAGAAVAVDETAAGVAASVARGRRLGRGDVDAADDSAAADVAGAAAETTIEAPLDAGSPRHARGSDGDLLLLLTLLLPMQILALLEAG